MFINGGDNVSLMLVGRDGTGLAPIRLVDGSTVTDHPIGWTPDGTTLVTVRDTPAADGGQSRLHVLTVADDGLVTDDSTVGPRLVTGPFVMGLSPDGTRVATAAAETDGDGRWRVAAFPLDDPRPPC